MHDQLQELQELLYTAIPITKYLSLTVAHNDSNGLRLAAPLAENINHFGTAFAGSLSAVTTLAGWSMLWFLLKELDLSGEIVIQDSTCKYILPVTQNFSAFCYRPAPHLLDKFERTLRQHHKARLELTTSIFEGDKMAVSFQGRYVVQLKNESNTSFVNTLER